MVVMVRAAKVQSIPVTMGKLFFEKISVLVAFFVVRMIKWPHLRSLKFHYDSNMITTKSLFQAEGLDDRSLEFLVQAIEKNNLPGFDYFEFKRAVASLIEMNLDEPTAYKSAFATAATLGLTKEKLIETAAYYRNVVDKEKQQFAQALENQNQTKVTTRQEEVKRLRDQIERNKTEITRIQDEIAGYLNQVDAAEAALKSDSERLEKAKSSFEQTHAALLLQLDRDTENLHKHL
jgi:hypothetical protein